MPTVFGLLLRAWKRDGDPETLDMVERTSRGDAQRRNLRPGGLRVSSLLDRCAMARPPLREDALRPGTALPGLYRGVAGDGHGRVARDGAGDLRVRAPGPRPAGGGIRNGGRRRQRGRRGQVLRLDRLRSACRSSAAVPRSSEARYRMGPEGPCILHRDITDRDRRGRTRPLCSRRAAARVRPLRDDKILADWNGLMIAALARAGRAFGEPALVEAAEKRRSVRHPPDAVSGRRAPPPAPRRRVGDRRRSPTTMHFWPGGSSSCTKRRSIPHGCRNAFPWSTISWPISGT